MKKRFLVIFIFLLLFLLALNIKTLAFDFISSDGQIYRDFTIPEDVGTRFCIFITDHGEGQFGIGFPGTKIFNADDLIFRLTNNKYGYSTGNLTNWGTFSYYTSVDGKNWNNFYKDLPDVSNAKLLYSTEICYNMDGSINDFSIFNINLSTTEPTSSLELFSNNISVNGYEVYYSKDNIDNFSLMTKEQISDTNYFYKVTVLENGYYYFKFVNSALDFEQYVSVKVTNINSSLSSNLNLHLSTTEKTTEPIYVLSNKYLYNGEYDASKDFLNNYDIDVSYGYDETYGYAPLSVDGFDEEKQMNYRQYQFKIVVNGVYKFKIFNFETGEITYKTFIVDNIGIDNPYGEDVYYDNYDEDGNFDPTPVLFLDYVDTTTVRIRTQPFTFNEIINLKCSTKFEDGEYQENRNIYNYTVDTGNTIYDDVGDEYVKDDTIELSYFYIDVKVDGLYYFQFYNIENKKYTEGSIQVDINKFIIDNVENIDNFTDKMVAWSKLHFGFLTYPFELIINIFGRVQNISEEEPILTIPTLKEPFTKTIILNQTSYNLKEAVNISETSSFLYNIYLVLVDVILIFLFVMLCKKTFEEVFR